MPRKHSIKIFKEKSYYHVYNRGVAKQKIYRDEEDYKKFIGYLKFYLTPVDLQGRSLKVKEKVPPSRISKNHAGLIKLHCYCLMPNHFHLLLYQEEVDSMNYFMRSVGTKYAMYFNRKYKRTGPLFESRYKGIRVETENQLVYLSKYIHRNPIEILPTGTFLEGYKYSSYGNYLGLFRQNWVKTKKVLGLFQGKSYKKLVETEDDSDLKVVDKLLLDHLQGRSL